MKISEIKPGNILRKKDDKRGSYESVIVTKVCDDYVWVMDRDFVFFKIYEKRNPYDINFLDDYELFVDYSGECWKERVES